MTRNCVNGTPGTAIPAAPFLPPIGTATAEAVPGTEILAMPFPSSRPLHGAALQPTKMLRGKTVAIGIGPHPRMVTTGALRKATSVTSGVAASRQTGHAQTADQDPLIDDEITRIQRPPAARRRIIELRASRSGGRAAALVTEAFRGRIGLGELLVLAPEIARGITERTTAREIRELAHLPTLMANGLEQVARGRTTLSEVVATAWSPEEGEPHAGLLDFPVTPTETDTPTGA